MAEDSYPGVIPMLAYENGVAALEWLTAAFGFRERTRMVDANGRLTHAELDTGDGIIMLATPSPAYEAPNRHREHCDAARAWSEVPYIIDGVLVYVADVQEHCRRAREHAAHVLTEPQQDEHGPRYRVEDVEGHRWMFMERGG